MPLAQTERFSYSRKPLLREALVGLDIAALFTSSVWIGRGVSRGDGSAVVVIPGFDSKDFDTGLLRSWLGRIGYYGQPSGIPFANTDPEYYEERIGERVNRLYQSFDKVHLIGHSIGGIIARAIAYKRPEKIKSVTTLGSPLRGDLEGTVDPFVLFLAKMQIPILRDRERLDERRKELTQSFWKRSIRTTSIYTKDDGVVDWRSCVDTDPGTENYEVLGTHMGLILNPQVYAILGEILSKSNLEKTETSISSKAAA